jgi:hypothetical protein
MRPPFEAGVDPVALPLNLLESAGRKAGSAPNSVGGARRQAALLARCAQKAEWGKPLPQDIGLGITSTFAKSARCRHGALAPLACESIGRTAISS